MDQVAVASWARNYSWLWKKTTTRNASQMGWTRKLAVVAEEAVAVVDVVAAAAVVGAAWVPYERAEAGNAKMVAW